MFEKRFTQMREFRRKCFIPIHRIIKHLNQTMKFELLSKIKTLQGTIRKDSPNGPTTDNVTTL